MDLLLSALQEQASSADGSSAAVELGVLIDAKRGVFFFSGDAVRRVCTVYVESGRLFGAPAGAESKRACVPAYGGCSTSGAARDLARCS